MKIIDEKNKIKISELKKMSKKMFDDLVKAVVDVGKEIMAVDAGMHVDQETLLLQKGSKQNNLWGINIRPQYIGDGDKMIEFDSMVNLRPSQGNRSRGVDDLKIKEKIIEIVNKLIIK
ncbi:MAG: hypothetical protein CEN92_449 [Candidatus Berkelbacteria bacterium Licking1014_96]|uniref:Uncharacterized protein n=1 Tax=Candidatus Berkelbacteria bacterium Licking1014_96 TaxID=2017149 RepID=A0A554LCK2_9BACT|nr:MAG: hypothetical protein CEN92_449 [Candidatus Berkelbacteria bacterium Licking1014_96]